MPETGGSLDRSLQKAKLGIRIPLELGPRTTSQIVANSWRVAKEARRRRHEARGMGTSRTPGELLAVERLPGRGLRCQFAEAELEIVFLSADAVRISWGPDPEPLPYSGASWSWDPGAAPASDPAPPFEVDLHVAPGFSTEAAGASPPAAWTGAEGPAATAGTVAQVVEVEGDGALSFRTPDGRLLRRELPPRRRRAVRTLRTELRPGEVVTGFGEQPSPFDRRGGTCDLWNTDPGGSWGPGDGPLYSAVPVELGLHRDGDVLVLHETSHRMKVRLDGREPRPVGRPQAELELAGGMVRHVVATGTLPRLSELLGELTGRPAMPPRWALGYHQCRWGYRSEGDIEEVVRGFADEGLPLSAVHLDIDYLRGYRVFTVNRERFPDLGGLCRSLAERGIRVVTIIDPGVKADPDYDVYREGIAGGHFLTRPDGEPLIGVVWPGRSVFPDFTRPATREWWKGLYRRLLDDGVAGIWHDMNEPTSMTMGGDPSLPGSARHDVEGRGGSHAEVHNVYGMLMDQAGWQAQAEVHPDRRPYVLSRAGWAGVQRWAWLWTADIESTFAGLRQQVATLVGMSLSGVPFLGCDIGGFSGVPSPELYVRWLELSIFLPMCRTHSALGIAPREPWRFPQPFRDQIGELIKLRYRLLPYLYSAAYESAQTARPMLRPACWPETPDGEAARRSLDDQFLLGDALLVVPVTEAGATSRRLRLPPGQWYPWRPLDGFDGSLLGVPGGQGAGPLVKVEAPVGNPVVAVRAGSLVPLDDAWTGSSTPGQITPGHEPVSLAWHCWPDGEGRAAGWLYDDPGDGPPSPAEAVPHRLEHLTLAPGPGGLVLEREVTGDAPPPDAFSLVVHGWPVASATAGGRRLELIVESPSSPPAADDLGTVRITCPGDVRRLELRTDRPT